MNSKSKPRAVSIRLTVVVVFMLATLLTASLAIGLQFHFGKMMATEAATELYTTASSGIANKWRNIGEQNTTVVALLSENPTLANRTDTDQHLATLAGVMTRNPLYYGVYLGHADGSFFELVNLDASEAARKSFRATPSDKWILITIDGTAEERVRRFEYMDNTFKVRIFRSEPTDFDVTSRPWYSEALKADNAYATQPYLFAQLGVPGRTLSKQVAGTDSVIGIDMTLATVSEFLREQDISQDAELFIYKADGQIIASSRAAEKGHSLPVPALSLSEEERNYIASLPPLVVSNEMDWPPYDYALLGQPRGYSIDILRMVASMTGLEFSFVNGLSWGELVEQFEAGKIDLLHSLLLTEENSKLGLPTRSYERLPYAFVTKADAPSISSVSELSEKTLAIPSGWSVIPVIKERFPLVNIVEASSTLNAIELVLDGSVDAALDNEVILRYIERHYFLSGIRYDINIDLGSGDVPENLHILAQKDAQQLVAIIDKAIATIGATQREYLHQKWLEYETAETPGTAVTVPSDTLVKATTEPAKQEKLLDIELEGAEYFGYIANLAAFVDSALYLGMLVPQDAVIDPFMRKVKLSSAITAGFLLLLLPLSWAFATPIVRPIRQLAIENYKVRQRQYDDVQRVPSRITEI